MKQFNNYIIAILIGGLMFSSCEKNRNCIEGTGSITTKTISVPSFTGIDLSGALDVVISQGPVQEITAVGHSNIISLIKKDVHNGIWDVTLQNGCYKSYDLTIYITVPNIKDIDLSGSGNVVVNDFSNQTSLSINISGSGDITLNKFDGAHYFEVGISGSGKVRGNEDFADLWELSLNINGSGSFNGFPIQTLTCSSSISGSGNCEVNVENELRVDISGSGNVLYKGRPSIYADINEAGSIIDAN